MLIYILVGLTEYMNILKTKLFDKTHKKCLIYKDDFKVLPYHFPLFCKKIEKKSEKEIVLIIGRKSMDKGFWNTSSMKI